MELKRILAHDTKSATEKAMALYGRNVLVISNHMVGGQTELVVAIDIEDQAEAMAAATCARYSASRPLFTRLASSAAATQGGVSSYLAYTNLRNSSSRACTYAYPCIYMNQW